MAKDQINGKSVGRNVILVVDGTKYSKSIKLKADREAILSEVELYNKRNSVKRKKAIIALVSKDVTTEKERVVKAKAKSTPKVAAKKPKAKKAPKKALTALEEAKALLEKEGFTVAKTAPKSTRRGQGRREH